MMIFKRVLATMLAVFAIFASVSCGTDLSSTSEESRTVMTVDGYEVPYEMYRYAVMLTLRDKSTAVLVNAGDKESADVVAENDSAKIIEAALKKLSEDEKNELKTEVEAAALETVTNIYSLFKVSADNGVDPFGDRINELTDMKMEELRVSYGDGDDEKYLETLKQYYMNDSVLSILTRYEIVFDDLYEQYVKKGVIDTSDEAVLAYVKGDNTVRAKQILISFERHSEEEALSIANEVLGKVAEITSADGVVDEEAFDLLTDKYGEDLYTFKNRDGYYICRGYSDESFEEAAFELEIGHASGIVRTSAGYSIMMRAEKQDAYIESHMDSLRETSLSGIYKSMVDEFSANAKTETNDEFKEIDIFSIK